MSKKTNKKNSYNQLFFMVGFLVGLWGFPAGAQTPDVPSSADVGRIKPEKRLPELKMPDNEQRLEAPAGASVVSAPKGAESVRLVLNDLRIEGSTRFTSEELRGIYAPYLHKEITLDVAYAFAEQITQRYRDAGYFLSVAYVPNQRIADGVVTLRVVEGYVGEVSLPEGTEMPDVLLGYIQRLIAKKPVKASDIESFLLSLNDLPGYAFSGTLASLEGAGDGAVRLALIAKDEKSWGRVDFDNASSRYLGPNELSATYSHSFFRLHQTTFSALTSLPVDKLNYVTLNHAVTLAPDLTLDVTGSLTRAQPGFDLEPLDIESESSYLGVGLSYQWIRQRQENLSTKLSLDGRNTESDLLGTLFTRDKVRAVRANLSYDTADGWQGYNLANITLSHGLGVFGSSEKGDLNLSRALARPDFTKIEASLTRLQALSQDWSVLASATGQWASGPLFSSEEFGYGGQGYGRAFDTSELTGDHGVAASVELRYAGLEEWQQVRFLPYGFYDIGRVWNDDIAQVARESAASAGVGLRFSTSWEQTGNLGVAWPLVRPAETPIYGQSEDGPRVILKISQGF